MTLSAVLFPLQKAAEKSLFSVLLEVGLQGFSPDGVAFGVAGVEQVRHHAFFKDTLRSEEVFADIDPDDIFVVAEFYDFGINFFVLDTAGIFVVFAAGENCIK